MEPGVIRMHNVSHHFILQATGMAGYDRYYLTAKMASTALAVMKFLFDFNPMTGLSAPEGTRGLRSLSWYL